jgi:uncharacterized protein YjbI with pentapeptide repeats
MCVVMMMVTVGRDRRHLIGAYLMGVHLIGVYLTGVHLIGVYLINIHLTGVHLWACISRACTS